MNKYSFFIFLSLMACSFQAVYAQGFYAPANACLSESGGQSIVPNASEGGCDAQVQLFDEDPNSVNWNWNYQDGNAQGIRNPRITFSSEGTKTIELTKTLKDGTSVNFNQTIKVSSFSAKAPAFAGKTESDTTVCGDSFKLDPYEGALGGNSGLTYLWSPMGETTPTIDVTEGGCYSVQVTDANGCSRVAKINVTFCLGDTKSNGGNEKWYFGNKGQLEFGINYVPAPIDSSNLDQGDLFTDPDLEEDGFDLIPGNSTNPINSQNTYAMLFGENKQLLYYTDGKKVYGGQDVAVGSINYKSSLNQGLSIIPKPVCHECNYQQYYVFGVKEGTDILAYSIIDSRLNNGTGGILYPEGIPFSMPVSGNTIGIYNDENFILISHESNSGAFNISTIDSTGINTTRQVIGTDFSTIESSGEMAISNDNTKIAYGFVQDGVNKVGLLNFDPATGQLSNSQVVDLGIDAPPTIFGLSFSPNSSILYATLMGNTSSLIQLDVSTSSPPLIKASLKYIVENSSIPLAGIKAGPSGDLNGSIYIASPGSSVVQIMQSPNELEDNDPNTNLTGYKAAGAPIPGKLGLSFPSTISLSSSSSSSGINSTYRGACLGAPTILDIQSVCDPLKNRITWQFEDGSTLTGNLVSYEFPTAGWHKIKVLFEIFEETAASKAALALVQQTGIPFQGDIYALMDKCKTSEKLDSIKINPAPSFDLPDSLAGCFRAAEGSGIAFGALANPMATGEGRPFTYEWLTPLGNTISGTGPNDSVHVFTAKNPPGTKFTLNITNVYKCVAKDRFSVYEDCEAQVWAPQAFTPNRKDNLNDTFMVNTFLVGEFKLFVYNRWGELIFESNDPENGWDGTVNGTITPNANYPYTILYKSKFNPETRFHKKVGTVRILD